MRKLNRIIDRYVMREVAGPFALGVGLLTFALVAGRLLKLTEMVVNHGVTLSEVLGLVGYIMPGFLELSFPMAVLLGVLLGFGRMSNDQELTAARACGISLYRLAMPAIGLAIVVWAVSSWFAFDVRPWANARLRMQLYALTRTRTTAGLQEKVFNRSLPGLVVYVDRVGPSDSSLSGVLISDERDPLEPNAIVARSGFLFPNANKKNVTLRLFDGSVFGQDTEKNASHVTSFKVYDLTIRPEDLGIIEHDPEEMPIGELRRTIAKGRAGGHPNYEAEAELARKYTIPFATVLFALLGVSLGLKPARGGQSERFGMSVALFFLYYALMRVGQALAERGKLDALLAMSIPDVAFTILALWLFYRSATDRGDQGRGPGDVFWDLVERLERKQAA
ncbi:MAG: LPS export ABC transporter permease LptF [Candidatus Binataceae bacterium]